MLISQIGCSDNCDCSNISLRSGRARRRAVLKLQLRRVSPQAASLQARTDDAIGENENGAFWHYIQKIETTTASCVAFTLQQQSGSSPAVPMGHVLTEFQVKFVV